MLKFRSKNKNIEDRIEVLLSVISILLSNIGVIKKDLTLNKTEINLLKFMMLNSKEVEINGNKVKGFISKEYIDIYSKEYQIEDQYLRSVLTHLKNKGYIKLNPYNKRNGRCLSSLLIKVLDDLKNKDYYEVRI